MKIKVVAYDSTWAIKWRVQNIKNINKLEFSETANWWQWNFNIELWVKFDDFTYEEWDYIEYSVYSEKYKEWLHKYTWIVKWVERTFDIGKWESVKLLVEWLITLLSDFEMSFSYNWMLKDALDNFVNRLNTQYSITNSMQYLGNIIFKNWVTSEENINVSISSKKAFDVLKEIFWENRSFYLDKTWTIKLVNDNQRQRIVRLNHNISKISINKSWQINIDLSWYEELDLTVWDIIYVQNINRALDLNWRRVQELAFWIDKIWINIWKIENYTKVLK